MILQSYLQRLMISSLDMEDLIDVNQWEQLITIYLPLLSIFKFVFYWSHFDDEIDLINTFNEFRTDFWEKHQWFTEYVIAKDLSFIYTIPFL